MRPREEALRFPHHLQSTGITTHSISRWAAVDHNFFPVATKEEGKAREAWESEVNMYI